MTRPRTCSACGTKPVATKKHQFCFDCQPGGPHIPPPCRRCGTTDDYYSAGLCRRCHQYAPQQADSCRDCHAWGVVRTHKWLCLACRNWRRSHPTTVACTVCSQIRALNQQEACRLCWRQAANLRAPRQPVDILGANRHGQQLFFADMHHPARSRNGPPPRPHLGLEAAPKPARPPSLFDQARPEVETLDRIARDHALRYGWSNSTLKRTRRGIRILADRHPLTHPIPASQLGDLATLGVPIRLLLAILAEAGQLTDDRTPAIETWFKQQIADLPSQMVTELGIWFDVLHTGSPTPPRSRPRSPVTIRTRLRWALPTLKAWAADGHQSLREISRSDITAALPASGNPRATLGIALRSIFGTLKAHKVIFTNPITRTNIGAIEGRQPLPIDLNQLRQALNSTDPAQAALTALIAFHGLRSEEVRQLTLTDIHDGRLHLADRTVVLAEPVKTRLGAWLDHRNQRWPNTANPHLFIHYRTATGTGPVGGRWVGLTLGMSPHALRQDRILDEVNATDGDVRRLSDLFGVTVKTALRYAEVLDHPDLTVAENTATRSGSRTQGSK